MIFSLDKPFTTPATPDTSLFTYDESSGYYYDISTNLYYDATSQYFYNSEINQFMYWDQLKTTYVLAPASSDNGNGHSAAASAHQVSLLSTTQSNCSNVLL